MSMYRKLLPVVAVTAEGPVRVMTLNRPDHLNAANVEMHRALSQAWTAFDADADARAIVLTGAGRAFCAGGDLDLIDAMRTDLALRRRVLEEGRDIVRTMASCPLPIVAAVNGAAIGLGCSIASLCDVVLIEEHAYFSDPHVSVGLVAGDGGAVVWPLLMSMVRAKEYLFTGDRIDAATAVEIGLANRIVPTGASLSAALELAQRIAMQPPAAVQGTKRVLNRHLQAAIREALDFALQEEHRTFDTPELAARLAAMRLPR